MRWHRLQWYLARISIKAAPQTGQQGIFVSSDAIDAGVREDFAPPSSMGWMPMVWGLGLVGFWFESAIFGIELGIGILRRLIKRPFAIKDSDYDIPTGLVRRQPTASQRLRKPMFSGCLPCEC
jgi:hypothetical protein